MGVLLGRGSVHNGGSGATPVLATAALIDESQGRFTLSAELLEMISRRVRRGDGPLDVVLFARDAAYALLLRLPPEIHLVGVVAEREMAFVAPTRDVAVVSGATGALSAARDGSWVIVDPARGRVLIDPEAQEIARLQSMRPSRPSILLGAAHTPATTLSGRTISVWATVQSTVDVGAALRHGADGILIIEGGDLLSESSGDADDEDADAWMFAMLSQAADAFGGGEVGIAAGMDAIHPRTVVRLAARCRLTWAVHPASLPCSLAELLDEMQALIDDEEEQNDGAAALPRLAAVVTEAPIDKGVDDLSLVDFDEALWMSAAPPPSSIGFLPPLVRVVLPETDVDGSLTEAVFLGASGVVTTPANVETIKNSIRQQE